MPNNSKFFLTHKHAIAKNARALQQVPELYIRENPEEYKELISIAINKNALAFEFINEEYIATHLDSYHEIIQEILKKNSFFIAYINKAYIENRLTDYIKVIKLAVKKNGLALDFVNKEFINTHPIIYHEVSLIAVKATPGVIRYINPDDFTDLGYRYNIIAETALKLDLDVFVHVKWDKIILDERQIILTNVIEVKPTLINKLTTDFVGGAENYKRLFFQAVNKDLSILGKTASTYIQNNLDELVPSIIKTLETNPKLIKTVPNSFIHRYPERYQEMVLVANAQPIHANQNVSPPLPVSPSLRLKNSPSLFSSPPASLDKKPNNDAKTCPTEISEKIEILINKLTQEINSCWPYPHKDRKQEKVNFLEKIKEHTNNHNLADTIIYIAEIIKNYPNALIGNHSKRTAELIQDLRDFKEPTVENKM